jgi:hypothetical protein
MNPLRLVWDELLAMFVDDGALALQVVALIAALVACIKLLGLNPLIGGILLLLGCLAILIGSLLRKTRHG